MGGSPCRPRGPPGDHGWRRASAGTGVREIKKKTQKPFSKDRSVPRAAAVQERRQVHPSPRMSGRKEGRVERGPPAEAAAEGSQRPPLPAPLTPRSSTGGPRLRIPSHDRRAGRGWRRPGGAAAPGWGGAPLGLLTRGTGGWPPSSSAGSRSAPQVPLPPGALGGVQ